MNSSLELPVIGIIGIKGKYGMWLDKHFSSLGFSVMGSDLNTELKNKDIVEKADVVIFSVPIVDTPNIISELIEFSREDQLWMDVTSVKVPAVTAMLQSKAEVVGLHPMCAPTVETLKGQNLIVCRARISQWEDWLQMWLQKTEAYVTESTPEEHDKYTALVQGLVHALTLTFVSTLSKTGVDIEKLQQFASPTFKAFFALTGRILGQNPEMYSEIQMANPAVPKVLETASDMLDHMHEIVMTKDREKFIESFNADKLYMGEKGMQKAKELFDKFLKG